MGLKEGTTLYVRADYKIEGKDETEQEAMECFEYLQNLSKERYLVTGLFGDMEMGCVDGAMVIFEAKDMEEAKRISDADPIISGGFYRYELRQWNVMLTS